MPVTARIEGEVVVVQPRGAHGTDELRAAWLVAEQDPAFPAQPRVCVDMRASESLANRSIAEMRQTADWFMARVSAGRLCAFVARPGLQYGLARILGAWIEVQGWDSHVTTDLDDAIRWLQEHRPAAPPAQRRGP